DSSAYWSAIEKIIADNQIDMAVILPELEVLEWSKHNQNVKLPCKALIPDWSVARLLVDKARMTAVLNELELVPPSVAFSRNEMDLSHVFDALGQVFWVRSTTGTSGLGSLKVNGPEALKNWIQI